MQVYEVAIYNHFDTIIGADAWAKRVKVLLNDPEQLRQVIKNNTQRVKAAEEVEREINHSKKNVCITKCPYPITDDTVMACINCKHMHMREMFHHNYYKCELIGITRKHRDIEPTNVCSNFERKT